MVECPSSAGASSTAPRKTKHRGIAAIQYWRTRLCVGPWRKSSWLAWPSSASLLPPIRLGLVAEPRPRCANPGGGRTPTAGKVFAIISTLVGHHRVAEPAQQAQRCMGAPAQILPSRSQPLPEGEPPRSRATGLLRIGVVRDCPPATCLGGTSSAAAAHPLELVAGHQQRLRAVRGQARMPAR